MRRAVAMDDDPDVRFRSPIMGDLKLPVPKKGAPKAPRRGKKSAEPDKPEERDPKEKVPILLEINVTYPGGLQAVREDLKTLWDEFEGRAGGNWEDPTPGLLDPPPIRKLMFISSKLYQCVLSREDLQSLVTRDQQLAAEHHRPPVIFRA